MSWFRGVNMKNQNLSGQFVYGPKMWSWVTISHDIGRYYRQLFLQTFGLKLERPCKDEHVTVTSWYDRDKINPIFWGVHTDKTICMTVDPTVWTNGEAVWLPIKSKQLDKIREELWLDESTIPFHFCIGYLT